MLKRGFMQRLAEAIGDQDGFGAGRRSALAAMTLLDMGYGYAARRLVRDA